MTEKPTCPGILSGVNKAEAEALGFDKKFFGRWLVPCPKCGEQEWIGPKLQEMSEKYGAPIICSKCLREAGLIGPETNVVSLGGK